MSAERRTLYRWLRQIDDRAFGNNSFPNADSRRGLSSLSTSRRILSRNDRVVSAARIAVAAATLLAVKLNLAQASIHADVIYSVAIAYLGYAVVLMLVVRRLQTTLLPFGIAAHVIDMVLYSLLVNATEAPTSPFFVLFFFSLLSATFRWGWRGALWTTLGFIAFYAALSFAFWHSSPRQEFTLSHSVLYCAYLLTMGAMLVLFSLYQRQFSNELIRLATWPTHSPSNIEPVSEALEYAAKVFGVPRVILIKNDALEPWVEVAVWCAGETSTTRLPPGVVDPLVPKVLVGTSFLARGKVALVHRGGSHLDVWQSPEPAISEVLRHRWRVDVALCFPVLTDESECWLLVPDRYDVTAEDFVTGGVAAARISAAFQQAAAQDLLHEVTAAENRLRLSRDLHDGVLQGLTGAALKLQAALQEHAVTPSLQQCISEVGALLTAEQRELRGFIERLRPGASSVASEVLVALDGYLEQLAGALRLQWGLEVVLRLEPQQAKISGRLAHQLRHILRESAANAAKHGNARHLCISAAVEEKALRLEVADNGTGMHEQGVFDTNELRRRGIGPRSLRERLAVLGGTLTLKSDLAGTRLDMQIPLQDRESRT